MKIIDSHIHFRPDYEGFSTVAENSGHVNTQAHLQEVFAKNNITHAIVMSNLDMHPSNHVYPSFLSYCIGLDSNAFGTRPLGEFVALAEENLKRPNCVGIKLYPGYCPSYVYDEIYAPFFALALKYNKVVAVHTGALASAKANGFLEYSHPLTLDRLAVKYPDVQIVMCHFGNPWLCDAAAVVSKNKNIAVDLSGILEGQFNVDNFMQTSQTYINMLKMWMDYVGDWDRFMYGTDWPLVNVENYIDFMQRVIPKEVHNKVFYENAKRIYNLKI